MTKPSKNARTGDPDTSHEAAAKIKKRKGCLRVLKALDAIGGRATASEIDRQMGHRSEYCHKRLSDCHLTYDWVEMTEERRRSLYSNRDMVVVAITDAGYEELRNNP